MGSLFNALSIGRTALMAQQAGMAVVGNNIANANTVGYTRQRMELAPLGSQDVGFGQLGTGVGVTQVRRLIDEAVESAIRGANATLGRLATERDTLERVEQVFNAISAVEAASGSSSNAASGASDLGSRLNEFFSALHQMSLDPSSAAVRSTVVESGRALASSFNAAARSLSQLRDEKNVLVKTTINEVNQYATEVADLNQRILYAENGGALNKGEANDLRDRRGLLLSQISERLEINAVETGTGVVNVFVGGDALVFGDDAAFLAGRDVNDGDAVVTLVEFARTGADVRLAGGSLAGLVASRDRIITDHQQSLDLLAQAVGFEFNRIHSEGIGLKRFSALDSDTVFVQDNVSAVPLATEGKVDGASGDDFLVASNLVPIAANLTGQSAAPFAGMNVFVTSGRNAGEIRRIVDFDPAGGRILFDRAFTHDFTGGDTFEITQMSGRTQNGAFALKVYNENTGLVKTVTVKFDKDGVASLGKDDTLNSLVTRINTGVMDAFGIPAGSSQALPVSASITGDNRLRLASTSDDYTFYFGQDSSDFLAAAGFNTFFTGRRAADLQVSREVQEDATRVASSTTGNPGDNTIALELAKLGRLKVMNGGTEDFNDFFIGMASTIGVQLSEAKDLVSNQQVLSTQLQNERERISGVNIDEEAIQLISFQRAFQASARFISIVDQLLQALINSV
ncbi:MAG: flagellar hook-associated protein FlgK [Planctomycetes bacterium]|nr:flagellar hook-associated protein FlgK [Planctomycetota bacterium]